MDQDMVEEVYFNSIRCNTDNYLPEKILADDRRRLRSLYAERKRKCVKLGIPRIVITCKQCERSPAEICVNCDHMENWAREQLATNPDNLDVDIRTVNRNYEKIHDWVRRGNEKAGDIMVYGQITCIHSQTVTEWARKGINRMLKGLSTTVLRVIAGLHHMPDEAIDLVECECLKRRFMQNQYPAIESMSTTILKEMLNDRQHRGWLNIEDTEEQAWLQRTAAVNDELDKRREARNHTSIKVNTTRTEVMKAAREDQKWERRRREADQWAQTETRRMLRHYKEEAERKARLRERQVYDSQLSQVTDATEYEGVQDSQNDSQHRDTASTYIPLLLGEDLLNQEDHHAIIEARDHTYNPPNYDSETSHAIRRRDKRRRTRSDRGGRRTTTVGKRTPVTISHEFRENRIDEIVQLALDEYDYLVQQHYIDPDTQELMEIVGTYHNKSPRIDSFMAKAVLGEAGAVALVNEFEKGKQPTTVLWPSTEIEWLVAQQEDATLHPVFEKIPDEESMIPTIRGGDRDYMHRMMMKNDELGPLNSYGNYACICIMIKWVTQEKTECNTLLLCTTTGQGCMLILMNTLDAVMLVELVRITQRRELHRYNRMRQRYGRSGEFTLI